MSAAASSGKSTGILSTERYVKEALLGRGAWGVVHRARDAVIGRVVALKVIPFDAELPEADRHELAARSEREARAAGALNHPNIVTLYDAGRAADDSSFFIVMEYVEGSTLRQRLASGPVAPAEAARVGVQVAEALHYAHERGIVHRDVKPANILLRGDGVAKLADFGIARIESSDITRSGQSMGSPAYMSPEQSLGLTVDARSDTFSLGVVLYEMLAGRKPFESDSLAALCYQIVHDDPPPPSARRPGLPEAWDALVMKAMAKRPEDRFATAAEFARALREVAVRFPPAAVAVEIPAGAAAPAESSGGTLLTAESGGARTRARRVEPREAAHPGTPAPVPAVQAWPRLVVRYRGLILGAACIAIAAFAVARVASWLAPAASVRVELLHGLKSGEVTLSVDGKVYWKQTVLGSDEGGFKEFTHKITGKGSGRVSTSLQLPAGMHLFAVTVTSGDESWSDSTKRRIAAGDGEATLSIRVRTGLTRGMELDWK